MSRDQLLSEIEYRYSIGDKEGAERLEHDLDAMTPDYDED